MNQGWVYIQSERELWTSGHYQPNGDWCPESDHSTKAQAAARVHYLNGGNPMPLPVLVKAARAAVATIRSKDQCPTPIRVHKALVELELALAPFQEEATT